MTEGDFKTTLREQVRRQVEQCWVNRASIDETIERIVDLMLQEDSSRLKH